SLNNSLLITYTHSSTLDIYPLSLHDALPISMYALGGLTVRPYVDQATGEIEFSWALANAFYPLRSTSNGIAEGVMKSVIVKVERSEEHTSELQSRFDLVCRLLLEKKKQMERK